MGRGVSKGQKKVAAVMREYKRGELHSGKGGSEVTDRKQALAIALSIARRRGMMKK